MVMKLLRRATGSWTLERKSMLFFGTTLLVSVTASSLIMHFVTKNLVMETTHQTAADYARLRIYNKHMRDFDKSGKGPLTTLQGNVFNDEIRASLYEKLIENKRYQGELISTTTPSTHDQLSEVLNNPVTGPELEMLKGLESQFRAYELELAESERNGASTDGTVNAVSEVRLSRTSPGEKVFRESGPVDGWYTYYYPIRFSQICLECHRPLGSEKTPFCVMRVRLPAVETTVWTVTILSAMISWAMVTLAVTMLIMHLIMRRLVISPLQHLRSVSEEIIRGELDQRAEIDTDDEFRELADAFNRMLRHLTESQQQLQSLNQTLDIKVDQLAQANLHLYEANRLKSDFLANMSHELRTPLNSIIGFSDVLQDISSLTDKQRRYAANIQKSGRMLLEMINDILDLAKIEAGKLQVKPLLFNINQVLQAQCDMMRSLSEEKNIDVQLVPDTSLELVFQDAPKIQQIVNNLLSNAVKFTPEGGLVTISTGTVNTDYFHVTITDTGVGIPESDFEVIFEKFRQSNAILQGDNLTRQYSGTGLGLSIVKELCKLLGGEISLTSHVGKGSTFRVTLPRHYNNTNFTDTSETRRIGEGTSPES